MASILERRPRDNGESFSRGKVGPCNFNQWYIPGWHGVIPYVATLHASQFKTTCNLVRKYRILDKSFRAKIQFYQEFRGLSICNATREPLPNLGGTEDIPVRTAGVRGRRHTAEFVRLVGVGTVAHVWGCPAHCPGFFLEAFRKQSVSS